MKLNFASLALMALALPVAVSAQDAQGGATASEAYTSGSQNYEKFTNASKKYNDWAISAGIGSAIIQTGNITSIKNGQGKAHFGYSYYFSVDKMISHTVGLKLQYDKGETRQGFANTKDHVPNTLAGRTQYDALSLLGDLNLSNLLRRVDNRSPYRWALHVYAGAGTLAYKSYLQEPKPVASQSLTKHVKPFRAGSLFAQWGGALKYRASKHLDIEGRLMYVWTGDNEFDGAKGPYTHRTNKVSDNMMTGALGLTYNIGKHQSALFWHDPMQELYYKVDNLGPVDMTVCKNGDNDDDGVCDDWDRELNTPKGARVDGAGVALDVDLDGVIDLYDECVTVPGPASNKGCPEADDAVVTVNKMFEGIEFALDSDVIRPQSYDRLNSAADVIKSLASKGGSFLVIGGTDDRASQSYNLGLSQRRATAVVKYLVNKGVPASALSSVGVGKENMKYPECVPASKCPEWKNEANRRVYFIQK